jgi:EAL domain-containing protein (putative c-di-GMP-specific phosphodiesterase class I)
MRVRTWSRLRDLDEFERVLASRDVRAGFQPILDLESNEIVGFEALARLPDHSSYSDVPALFAEAYRRGRVGELDWICRGAVFEAVLEDKVPREVPIFLNVEPAAMNAPCPADIIGPFAAATTRCRFIVEVTERELADDPAELLIALDRARQASMGVALDDVGAEPTSLALMSLIRPDIIKLDVSLIQSRPSMRVASVVNAVRAESERTGALILAEGVESEQHRQVALSMGATLGQGWLFGAADALPDHIPTPQRPVQFANQEPALPDSPFTIAARRRPPIPMSRGMLIAISHQLEKAVLVSSFQDTRNFGPATRARYERLTAHTVLTAVLGKGMPDQPGEGIRGGDLHLSDPLCRQWTVAFLGPNVAGLLSARQLERTDVDGAPMFEAVVSHDRATVVDVARSLLLRVPGVARP